jgi:hypothetical protein
MVIHKIRDRKYCIELVCFKKDSEHLQRLQSFHPSKQKLGSLLLGTARFALSKELLTNKQLVQLWYNTVQALWEQPKKKNSNRTANNPWIYPAAMDMFVYNDLSSQPKLMLFYLLVFQNLCVVKSLI